MTDYFGPQGGRELVHQLLLVEEQHVLVVVVLDKALDFLLHFIWEVVAL